MNALTSHSLGEEIPMLWDAKPGDLVQFWRNNGTGHSVIYLGGTFTPTHKPISIKYWSIQNSGLGEAIEFFGDRPAEIHEVYIVRAKHFRF